MQVIGKALAFDPIAEARRAEELGYDGVRVIDHFFSGIPPEPPRAVAHPFVTLAAAAAATARVLLTQTMIAATFRHPVEVAQAVATLDRVSAGRAELGLGSGWFEAEHSGLGLELGAPRVRIARVSEVAAICREMFENDGTVHFDGDFFRAHCDAPWPALAQRPSILIGAHGPRMLRAAAAVADRIDLLEALTASGPRFDGAHANTVETLAQRVETAASAPNARPGLRFSATVNLTVAADANDRDRAVGAIAEAAGCDRSAVAGDLLRVVTTEDEALDRLRQLPGIGVDRIHIRPVDARTANWLDGSVGALQALP